MLHSICVFCGASNAIGQRFFDAGDRFGRMLVEKNIQLVYGGGDSGVMGAVANGTLKAGGKVTGVFPKILQKYESEHKSLTEIIHVDDMHTRKWRMFQLSDAFVIFPGGFGTLDEAFEIITWKQLGTHHKPIVIYNQDGYWDHWIALTNHIIANQFARRETAMLYKVTDDIQEIIPIIEKELQANP